MQLVSNSILPSDLFVFYSVQCMMCPMKLYSHYKNKPYKYIGVAKHTETLKDVVIYEARYPNEVATLWVRPFEMFHEEIEVQGKILPRFRKVDLAISMFTDLTTQNIENMATLSAQIFGSWDAVKFKAKVSHHQKFLLLMAEVESRIVGFKLGYELNGDIFYSWMGGVLPEYRGLGIAADLMQAQHVWCAQQGYHKVQTKSQNRFREMMILNLKHGFDVIDTQESAAGGLKVLLEKKLR